MVVGDIFDGIFVLPGFAGLFGIEAEGGAVGVGVSVADGPAGGVAFVVVAEVAVAVDEIAGEVGEAFEGSEDAGVGGEPVGAGDEAFETEGAEEGDLVFVEMGLAFEEELCGVLIAEGAVVGHVPEGAEADAVLVGGVARGADFTPGGEGLVEGAIMGFEPVRELGFDDAELDVGEVFVAEGPEEEGVFVLDFDAGDGRVVDEFLPVLGLGVVRRAVHHF